ncbi:MAG: histidine ammonia-lyase [Firmicutes bacterium]|nr:histidine ammonia-lyase [Bacillota bacterium]
MIKLDGKNLTIEEVAKVARHMEPVALSEEAYAQIEKSRSYIEAILEGEELHYGINTGFGAFQDVKVSKEDLSQLQINLIRSHSVGVGEPLSTDVVRAMMVTRANALCRGNSGVRLSTVSILINMLNKGVHPVVPSRGSVGASGDLCPLSHIAMSMMGEGKSEFGGEIMDGGTALKKAGIMPLVPAAKEGLALINGTQLMAGIGSLALYDAKNLINIADVAGAMAIEVLLGTDGAFADEISRARPHKGQSETAANLRRILTGSEITKSHRDCGKVQDAYSLRCMPQVHGAARETARFAEEILSVEINSSVDNPLIFPESDMIISGGNFHGAPVAIVLESLALGLQFLSNMSERRIERMVNSHYSSGLPAFLSPHAGLQSGFMIAQYAAAAMVSENKVLCHPACCDTIPTSAGQEDVVSMGSISALKLLKILDHTRKVLAIELLASCEAMEYRKPLKPAPVTGKTYEMIREISPRLTEDRSLSIDIEKVDELLKNEGFISALKK